MRVYYLTWRSARTALPGAHGKISPRFPMLPVAPGASGEAEAGDVVAWEERSGPVHGRRVGAVDRTAGGATWGRTRSSAAFCAQGVPDVVAAWDLTAAPGKS